MKEKVYCGNCIHLDSGYDGETYQCIHPFYAKKVDNFLRQEIKGKKCSIINKRNDCKKFESIFKKEVIE